jgi:hypothetical protein
MPHVDRIPSSAEGDDFSRAMRVHFALCTKELLRPFSSFREPRPPHTQHDLSNRERHDGAKRPPLVRKNIGKRTRIATTLNDLGGLDRCRRRLGLDDCERRFEQAQAEKSF